MASKKDEAKSANKEPESTSTPNVAVEPGDPNAEQKSDIPPKRHIRDRVKDIEKRWGKEFTEVMADVHDHVFGTSDPHDVEKKEG